MDQRVIDLSATSRTLAAADASSVDWFSVTEILLFSRLIMRDGVPSAKRSRGSSTQAKASC